MSASDLDLVARRLVALAELDDPEVTPMVDHVSAEVGGTLVGLTNRIKTVESLRRKLADLLGQDPTMTVEEAAEQIYDALRFTVVADPDRYMVIHDDVLEGLRRQGADIAADDNRWGGPGYRGINARLRVGPGRRFEVQFHTRESFQAAKATRGALRGVPAVEHTSRPAGGTRRGDRRDLRSGSPATASGTLKGMSTVFCASHIGGPEPRVLARFVTDDQGLHPERLDRTSGHWVPDSAVAGYFTGHDDWAHRINRDRATQILEAWGFDPAVLDAPLAQPATA